MQYTGWLKIIMAHARAWAVDLPPAHRLHQEEGRSLRENRTLYRKEEEWTLGEQSNVCSRIHFFRVSSFPCTTSRTQKLLLFRQFCPWFCKLVPYEHMLTFRSPYRIKVIVSVANRQTTVCYTVLFVTRCFKSKNWYADDVSPFFYISYRQIWHFLTTGYASLSQYVVFCSSIYQRSGSLHTPRIPGMLAVGLVRQNQMQSTGSAPTAPSHSLAMASLLPTLFISFPKILSFSSLFTQSHSLGHLFYFHGF